ncbi:hypothetical protein A8E36_16125 [Burkholderia cenocepacia]|uniref:hypothetical protein n=2 Tax=Burkholderia cenocepacia TaxID=95486 RepID=UPI0009821B4D|nr:hypothetical protein [Burkholderia cenocepacia]ONT03950.1 hypothetical protein A8E37_13290 [Burkholderia cenocepacia]ONT05126.1 hypothetical protein A8E36_16125 [Burkholderia cenocepacia]ONT22186.1 hypothetical protein A8E40_18745 [Burkholderia cenocepacia]ONT43799.1 hypothetical protein A8E41_06035 [Burkholderia cenocepacia]ONT50598.1 hypothetical protein A8E39_01230 [Burkholderia cenocepacia]
MERAIKLPSGRFPARPELDELLRLAAILTDLDISADLDADAVKHLVNAAIDLLKAACSGSPHAAMLGLLQANELPEVERLSDSLKFYARACLAI